MGPEPFAFTIYRKHLAGKSVEQLSVDLKIPPERVAARLEAARHYLSAGTDGRGSVRQDRCARCGAVVSRGSLCAACRTFFAGLRACTS